ncbi:MAG: YicC family protein [Bacteroidetes bacterium]|nr:YicC family protein [Bacteroidota bacterium]
MIKSMTGYGKQIVESANRKYTIEIRTLNSKTLDLNMRFPGSMKDKEIEIRNLLAQELERGKVDVLLVVEEKSSEGAVQINTTMAEHYYQLVKKLSENTGEPMPADVLSILLKMPDVLIPKEFDADETEWAIVLNGFRQTVELVNQFRAQEGAVLTPGFQQHVQEILNLLTEVDVFESDRVAKVKERILLTLSKQAPDVQLDMNRLEQEMIYYVEKLDITEEKVRLKNNCTYFLEVLENESSVGKKLGFIAQEIGREINTLGSKANNSDMQRLVVLMKDELEKIKEQLFNIL